ncbi:MAG TPA: hypothetical protein VEB40_01480 [Flavipsychrobacter sp.]|nr:hypothetical protein [Flavipsychrobacter sp.]
MEAEKYLEEVAAKVASTPDTAPAQRAAFNSGFSFSKLPFDEQLAVWDYIWRNARSFWVKINGFLFLEKHISKKELHEKIWKTAVKWQDSVDDWGPCDCLAKIYTKILETHPDKVYARLQKWNKSKICGRAGNQ